MERMIELPKDLVTKVRARRRLPPARERRLRRLRSGLSELDVAKVVGVDRSTISRWESGQREPRGEMLTNYVNFLDALERL
jgi:transcriptional regulator with XRE-family HTH domain